MLCLLFKRLARTPCCCKPWVPNKVSVVSVAHIVTRTFEHRFGRSGPTTCTWVLYVLLCSSCAREPCTLMLQLPTNGEVLVIGGDFVALNNGQ